MIKNRVGMQPKELFQALLASTKMKRGSLKGTSQAGHWWTKMPQFLNMARYTLNSLQQDDVLDYDPFYLHITPAEMHPLVPKNAVSSPNDASIPVRNGQHLHLGLESFQFLLEQLPSIVAIEFSGQVNDPLKNPELLSLVNFAYRYNGAESIVYTDGLLLGDFIDEMVKSNLHTVVINLVAHRPSGYGLMSGKAHSQFVTILDNVKALLERKKLYRSNLSVELRMTIDLHNFTEIPTMIQFAEELGVDGIHFDNYLSPNYTEKSDRSLYSHHQHIVRYLQELEHLYAGRENFSISMPKLLELDMSGSRYCKDAFNTVSVDSELNVSACSRHLLLYGPLGKIWDEDFFNNPMYQWLRSIYSNQTDPDNTPEVPLVCQSCPKNLPGLKSPVPGSQVSQQQTKPWKHKHSGCSSKPH